MAFSAGTDAVLKLHDGTSLVDVSPMIRTAGLNRQREMYDTTTLGLNDRAFVGGLRNNSTTLEGPYDPTTDALFSTVLDSSQPLACEFYPAGEAGGGGADATHPVFNGQYLLSSYDITTPVDGMAGISANVQFSGPMTRATA